MTEYEIYKQIDELCKKFNIRPCAIGIEPTLQYGQDAYYSLSSKYIYFNRKHLDRITPSIVAHEFAHYLNDTRNTIKEKIRALSQQLKTQDFQYNKAQKTMAACNRNNDARKRHIHHGDDFVMCLKQVIKKSGIDYSVEREFKTVAEKLGKGGKTKRC